MFVITQIFYLAASSCLNLLHFGYEKSICPLVGFDIEMYAIALCLLVCLSSVLANL